MLYAHPDLLISFSTGDQLHLLGSGASCTGCLFPEDKSEYFNGCPHSRKRQARILILQIQSPVYGPIMILFLLILLKGCSG